MKFLLFMLFVALAIMIGVVLYRKLQFTHPIKESETAPRESKAFTDDPFGDSRFWELTPKQMIKLDETDYFVRKVIQTREGGYVWREFKLDNGLGSTLWLTVEDDEGLDLATWKPISKTDIQDGQPGDKTVLISSKAYALKESGSAAWEELHRQDQRSGHMHYYQYEAADGAMLAMQRYEGAEWDMSRGNRRKTYEFEIYPTEGVN